jgi:hypothetical protein
MKQKVTCPETGHLEEIEVTQDPVDGHLLGTTCCSRWDDELTGCAQICVHRLNQRLTNLMRRERIARASASPGAADDASPAADADAPPEGTRDDG